MSIPSESAVREKLLSSLAASHCEVVDKSGGTNGFFEVVIVSEKFEGLNTLQRHRLVNNVLEEELKVIHAFTQKTYTPKEWQKKLQQGN